MEHRKDYIEVQIEMLSRALRKLLEKLLKVNAEDNFEEIEKDILSDSIIDEFSLQDILKFENIDLLRTVHAKYNFTNEQIKLLGDVLFEYAEKISINKNIYEKVQLLYQYCQSHQLKTIDFALISKLRKIEVKLKVYKN